MSLRDSGTKSKKFLRVLAVFAVVAVLFVSTGVIALAETDGAETSVEQSEFKSGYPSLPKNASLSERLMYGLQVAGIGMTVVFLVLVIIMAILYVFKLVATSGSKKPVQAPAAKPAVSAAPASDDEATVVAIATAAIAAARGSSNCAFKVISITKIQ